LIIRSRHRVATGTFIVAVATCLVGAPSAFASATASFGLGDLVVAGTDAADTITVTFDSGNNRYVVEDTAGASAGTGCTTSGAPANTAWCTRPDTNARTIIVQGDPPQDGDFTDDGADVIKVAYGSALPTGDTATIVGEGGDDKLFGSPAQDFLAGGIGNDLIDGSGGPDEITGGGSDITGMDAGQDRLFGGPGSLDTLYDGEGNGASSTIGPDTIDGGACTPLVDSNCLGEATLPADQDLIDWADRTVNNAVDLSFTGTPAGGTDPPQGEFGENNTIRNIDAVDTGSGNDFLQGDGGDNSLNAGDGTNTVKGGNGQDGITGGANHDDLDGQGGFNDSIDARAGDDVVTSNDGNSDSVDCGSGGETSGDTVHEDSFDTISNCEHRDLGAPSGTAPEARGAFVRTQFESTVAHFKGVFNTSGEQATCGFDIVPERFFAAEGFTGAHHRRVAQSSCSSPTGDATSHDYGSLEGEGSAAHGLTPGEKYRYRFIVSNADGTSEATGANFTLTTADIEARDAYWKTTAATRVEVRGGFRTFGGQGTCTVVLEPKSFKGSNEVRTQSCSSGQGNVGEAVFDVGGLRTDASYHYRFQVTVNGVRREVTRNDFIIKTPPTPAQFQGKTVPTAQIKKALTQEVKEETKAARYVLDDAGVFTQPLPRVTFPPSGLTFQNLIRDGKPLAVASSDGRVVSVGAGNFAAGPSGLGRMFVGSGRLQYFKLTTLVFGIKVPFPQVVSVGSGGVVSVGAGNVVSVGAGNVVSVGAGNVVSVGAGNVVSVGSGGLEFFDAAGRVVGVGAGNIAAGPLANVVSVGAGNVVSVGSGGVVAVGAGNLTPWNGAALDPFLTTSLLTSAKAGELASIQKSIQSIAAGNASTLVSLGSAGRGIPGISAAAAKRRRSRSTVVWKARTKITRFGQKQVVLKPTRKGLKLLRKIVRTNVRLRKRHRRPLKLQVSVKGTFKPRHGKKVTVQRRATTKSRRRR
jgi:hypothetical protein